MHFAAFSSLSGSAAHTQNGNAGVMVSLQTHFPPARVVHFLGCFFLILIVNRMGFECYLLAALPHRLSIGRGIFSDSVGRAVIGFISHF
jgi:hypothetical protein